MSATAQMNPLTAEKVDRFVRDLRRDRSYRHVMAVVVCGSAARGEERTTDEGGRSDIDVMLITRSRSPALGRRLARIVTRHRGAGIEGGQVPAATLRHHRTLLNYEARHTGRVIDGDERVLDLVPMACPADVPKWEACRLLCNRLLEHVKLATGATSVEAAVSKTYEALGEAQLVLERRYRPTFRMRLDEVRARPFADPSMSEHFVGAVASRFGCGSTDLPAAAKAREDLLLSTQRALASCTSRPDQDVLAQLDAVADGERNMVHRAYWAVVTRRLSPLREDPVVAVWRRAASFLLGRSEPDLHRLLSDWERCPQILRPRAAR